MVTSRPSALKYPLSSATVNGAAGPSNFQSSENLTGCCAEEGPPKHAARMGATSPTRTIALRVWRIRRFLSGSLPARREGGSFRQIDQHNIGVLSPAVEDDVFPVGSNIERSHAPVACSVWPT